MSNIRFLRNAEIGEGYYRHILVLFIVFLVSSPVSLVLIGILSFTPLNIIIYPPVSDNILNFLNIKHVIFSFSVLLVLFFCVRFIHKRRFITLITSYNNIRWMRICKGMVIMFFILNLQLFIGYLIDPTVYEFTFNVNNFIWLVLASLIGLPLAAFVEEVIFRGYILQALALLTKRPLIPLLITSLFFGILHYWNGVNPAHSIYYVIFCILFGFTLGLIVLGEGGLETAIGIHIMNNIFLSTIVCDPLNIFGQLPCILTIYTDTSLNLIDYIPEILEETFVLGLTLFIIFWGKWDLLKKVLSWKEID